MKFWLGPMVFWMALTIGSTALAQRPTKKPPRAKPPVFKPDEFNDIFFADAVAQLQGEYPSPASMADNASQPSTSKDAPEEMATGKGVWKTLISPSSLEDLVKESKTRLDAIVTTPARFAGAVADARQEFYLLSTLMAVISQYPEEIRWQASAEYSRRMFARIAANCKVATKPVFDEASDRMKDLGSLMKGTKVEGEAEEKSWEETAEHRVSMKIMDDFLRNQLMPTVNNDKSFKQGQEEVLKYSELIAMYGQVLQQEGMPFADDMEYNNLAVAMSKAAMDAAKAARSNDAEAARGAVGRIDQTCNKCHESFR